MILDCPCGNRPSPIRRFHHGYALSCARCDFEGTYCFGSTPALCIEAWNDYCDMNYPYELDDATVEQMRATGMSLECAMRDTVRVGQQVVER